MTHNINGCKPTTNKNGVAEPSHKWDSMIALMKANNIDIKLIQETWCEGKWEEEQDGYRIFHYGPESQQGIRGSGGVAIILSPVAIELWKYNEMPQPFYLEQLKDDRATRMMGIAIRTSKSKKMKPLFIANVYAPCSTTPIEVSQLFAEQLNKLIENLSKPHDIFIGGDTNAKMGRNMERPTS